MFERANNPTLFSGADDLLLTAGLYKISIALFTANEIGVFAVLPGPTEEPISSQEVATRLKFSDVDVENLNIVLSLLGLAQIICKMDQGYAHSELSWKFLYPDSPEYLGDFIRLEMFLHQEYVQHGRVANSICKDYVFNRTYDEVYLQAMEGGAGFASLWIMRILRTQMAGRLLDLGGGSGIFSIYFCQKNPALRAQVVDLPSMIPIAQKRVQEANLSERISFAAHDITASRPTWPFKFDYLFGARLLYLFSEEQCARILEQYAALLKPGGKIMIYDFFLDKLEEGNRILPYVHAMNWLHRDLRPSYTTGKIEHYLTQVGCTNIFVKEIKLLNTAVVIGTYHQGAGVNGNL